MNGFINILKPPGMTSHDVISFLRRELSFKKIGHAGTLDPQAAGVLPVAVGQATRLIEYLSIKDKEYFCRLRLGSTSTTQDAWGELLECRDSSHVTGADIKKILPQFCGEIMQRVPLYSAIKKDGIPLYKLARQGKAAEQLVRQVTIKKLRLIGFEPPELLLAITCSKGTYIRTICHDIGQGLGTGGLMSFLVRTRVGSFSLENSLTLEEITNLRERAIQPADPVFLGLSSIMLKEQELCLLRQGQKIPLADLRQLKLPPDTNLPKNENLLTENKVAVLDYSGKFQALAEITESVPETVKNKYLLKPKKVFKSE